MTMIIIIGKIATSAEDTCPQINATLSATFNPYGKNLSSCSPVQHATTNSKYVIKKNLIHMFEQTVKDMASSFFLVFMQRQHLKSEINQNNGARIYLSRTNRNRNPIMPKLSRKFIDPYPSHWKFSL